MSISANINEKANLIWAIADKLTGVYKPHEYGDVILPLTVIRRFDCILADRKEAVLKKNESIGNLPMKDVFLCKESGFSFYNTSKYDFEKLLSDPDGIEANFRAYLNGFSPNVRNIIEKFNFDVHIARLVEKNLLFIVLQEFTTPKADLHPDKISNLEMGYIFEEIIRRFSEAHNEDAGQHYTPREVIELMVNILFYNDSELLTGGIAKTVYDPACGTGGMLSVAEDHLKKMNSSAELICFGQEINDQTYAICKADMLIKGGKADNIRNGNTLSNDEFKEDKFDYIISNPPFGREWKNDKAAVEKEAKKGFAGRFGAGLPAVGDGQMLFLQTAISKMKDHGSRIAIVHNGSPLFTGDAGSGP
ncbi:MAG: class I SAM-dependent DNA methyltransferase, partial [Clostridiaceae bacterium]